MGYLYSGYSGLRNSLLPIEHLDAELLAYPFASISAFSAALTTLNPSLPSGMVPLWRQTERDLLSRFPGMSIDELVIRRDQAWFGKPATNLNPISLDKVLQKTVGELINPDAGRARPRVTGERTEVEQRRWWRWLTFALPADLLLAAVDANCERLEMLAPRLRLQLAEGGLVEPHLHLKGAMGFPTLWASLMKALAEIQAKADMLESPGAEWDEGRGLAPLMLSCALSRLLLAQFLSEPRQSGFSDFLEQCAMPGLNRRFGAFAIWPLWRTVYGLAAGRAGNAGSFILLRDLYSRLIGPAPKGQAVENFDPVGYWFPAATDSHPDFGFTRAALAYLRGAGAGDVLFAKIFWQTVRGRVIFYRHVVQRPMTPGLQWFTRTYSRLSAPRKPIPLREFVQQAVRLSGPGLRALEVRVVPDDSLSTLVAEVKEVDKAVRATKNSTSPPELGLIFHFSRTRGKAAEKGRPAAWSRDSHDDPAAKEHNPSGYRYSSYYREQRQAAMTFANLLTAYPNMLERVRGVDLCTDELGVPLWVMLPLVRHVQKAADSAARYGRGRLRPLGVTVHAGEDYVHLLGGIRRVDEAMELLKLGEGSRIGHAVALGVSVEAWAGRARHLTIPLGERLFDLLWVWRVAKRIPEILSSWLPWVEQALVSLGDTLFGRPFSAELLHKWWQCMHTDLGLYMAGFPNGKPSFVGWNCKGDPEPHQILYRWLTNREVFRRSQELVPVDVQREVPLIAALQAHVRRRIDKRGIAVEINPSSNLLIGHLGDLTAHPLWRLCPPPGVNIDAPPVRVCIGSDDPITFATSLPEEYQLLADALIEAGVSGPDTDAWLTAARQNGLTSRFTMPRSDEELMRPMCIMNSAPPLL